MKTKLVIAILVGILALSTGALATIGPITLIHNNSVLNVDPTSQAGIFGWTVELHNQMAQSSYWYRIGGEGVAAPLSSLAIDHVDKSSAQATVYYTTANFDLSVLYSLDGGGTGSGTSDLLESVMITNKTGSSMAFHLFEYVNYDLNGTPAGETATRVSSTDLTQTEGTTWAEVNPSATNSYDMGNAATLLNKLNTASFTSLSGATSPYTGDAAFTLQWDRSIAGHGSATPIVQDLQVGGAPVPEPSSLLALIGALGIIPALRRRRH